MRLAGFTIEIGSQYNVSLGHSCPSFCMWRYTKYGDVFRTVSVMLRKALRPKRYEHYIHVQTYIAAIPTLAHLNLLKPTGYVMHHQFNIQQLYALPTLYLCVLYSSENKQRLVPLTA